MHRKILAALLAAGIGLTAGATTAGAATPQPITEGAHRPQLAPPLTIVRHKPRCARGPKVLWPEWMPMTCDVKRGQRLDIVMTHRTYEADMVAACDGMGGWLYRTPDGLWSVCIGVDY